MNKRNIAALSVFACLATAVAPALATDDPPPSSPPASQPDASLPQDAAPALPSPSGCVDLTRPRSRMKTNSRLAVKRHQLHGTASDRGCTNSRVALVSVSIALKHGKQCRFVTHSARLTRKGACKRPRWLSAKGTGRWILRLPKRMPAGKYQVLTRAVDSAGNVERAHARRLAIRPPHSNHKKK